MLYWVLSGIIALCLLQALLILSPVASAVVKDDIPQQEYLARVGVSTVRIVATYGPQTPGDDISLMPSVSSTEQKSSSTNTLAFEPRTCTGIGVVVAGTGKTVWVLTDGSLMSRSGLICKPPGLPGLIDKTFSLNTLSVYLNNTYGNASPTSAITGSISSISCSDTQNCGDGVSLFSFNSTTILPAVKLPDATSTTQAATAAIQLSQSLTDTAPPTATTGLQQYVTPTPLLMKETTVGDLSNLDSLENGTPIVNQQGFINGLYLKETTQAKLFKATRIAALLTSHSIVSDSAYTNVSSSWNDGISEYYLGSSHYANAHSDFTKAYNASNGQFQEAQKFMLATSKGSNGVSSGTDETLNNGIILPLIGFVPYFLLAITIGGIIALLFLVFLLNSLFRRAQRHREFVEADKQATIQAQHIQEMEAQQASVQPASVWSQQPIQQAAPYSAQQPVHGTLPPPFASFSTASATPAQSNALADYPTIDMGEVQRNGIDMEKTQPFPQKVQRTVRGGGQVGFEVITNTNPGIKRKHKPNEDSLFAVQGTGNINGQVQQIGVFIVADGMGGHANGQDASRLAIQTVIDYLLPRLTREGGSGETPEKLLVDSVQIANQAVHQHNVENNADMGTTVTATLVVDTTAYVANVGDSRTYLYRTSEGLAKVTRDHSVVASLVDAGIIKPDDIYTHPKRNQIYRSLGEKPFVEVDPFTVQLQQGDKLLLCSDGLWDMVRDPEIQRVLETPTSDPQQLGDNLIKAALTGGGEDNVSVIVINVVERDSMQLTPGLETIYIQDNVKMPSLS
ncbi:MAG: hypothetical protein NVS4B12_08190 [Ktedonobacteraceae bacterium]